MNLFNTLLIDPIINLLVVLYQSFDKLGLPYPLAFAIFALTVLLRVLLWPLTHAQLKSAKKIQSLRPHLAEIKKKHGHDKLRHQQEQAKLYKEHGVNPAAGCLPSLIQIPVLIALYQVLIKFLQATNTTEAIDAINKVLYSSKFAITGEINTHFLGLNLAQRPSDLLSVTPFIALVPILTGVLQLVLTKMTTPQKLKPIVSKTQDKKKGKEDKVEMTEMVDQMQSQMLFVMPAIVAFFAFSFPLGLTIYWNTFSILGILQQYLIVGWGGLVEWLPKNWYGKN